MDEPAYSDVCYEPEARWGDAEELCHITSGWTLGSDTRPLWESIKLLCQTDSERKFLYQYLRYARDRTFPMLIPQPRVGIAERRRPDFAIFVPTQHWNYRKYAIQLDKAHTADQETSDSIRDAELEQHGYNVISLRPKESGYFEEARKLIERVESELRLAKTQIGRIAKEVRVRHCDLDDDVPF